MNVMQCAFFCILHLIQIVSCHSNPTFSEHLYSLCQVFQMKIYETAEKQTYIVAVPGREKTGKHL